MRIVLLGPPGAGKGTQAKAISKEIDVPHISTGDILRNEIKNGTELGKKAADFVESGKLVPDEMIIEIIKSRIGSGELDRGFLMDGFPRNLKQAKMFSEMMEELNIKLDRVINIVVGENEVIRRLGNRRICSVCKSIFSIGDDGNNMKRCPKCGGLLLKRKDDSEDVVRHRLEVYESETKPLIDYYTDRGILANVDGSGKEEEITGRILENI
jgi:adenylate kinase